MWLTLEEITTLVLYFQVRLTVSSNRSKPLPYSQILECEEMFVMVKHTSLAHQRFINATKRFIILDTEM